MTMRNLLLSALTFLATTEIWDFPAILCEARGARALFHSTALVGEAELALGGLIELGAGGG